MSDIEEKKADIIRDGYTTFPNFLSPQALKELQDNSSHVLQNLNDEHRERFKSNGSLCNFADHPEFADIIANENSISLLKELGADPKWIAGYLISKPPGGPPLFWHQDWWGWEENISYEDQPTQLFFMFYLVDTDVSNGCLRVIPGSHRTWHDLHDLPAAHGEDLATVENPDDPAFLSHPDEVAIKVKAGDLLVGDARLLHSAYANKSGAERPLLTLWYVPNFNKLPEAVQARYRSIYNREELDVDAGAEAPVTVDDWPDAQKSRVASVCPTYDGNEPPLKWNRSPSKSRMES